MYPVNQTKFLVNQYNKIIFVVIKGRLDFLLRRSTYKIIKIGEINEIDAYWHEYDNNQLFGQIND